RPRGAVVLLIVLASAGERQPELAPTGVLLLRFGWLLVALAKRKPDTATRLLVVVLLIVFATTRQRQAPPAGLLARVIAAYAEWRPRRRATFGFVGAAAERHLKPAALVLIIVSRGRFAIGHKAARPRQQTRPVGVGLIVGIRPVAIAAAKIERRQRVVFRVVVLVERSAIGWLHRPGLTTYSTTGMGRGKGRILPLPPRSLLHFSTYVLKLQPISLHMSIYQKRELYQAK